MPPSTEDRPLRTAAIAHFLQARTHPDLAALYAPEMETQVVVAPDGGERVEGDYKGKQWHGYSDGFQTWKPFRIPLDPGGNPHYTDTPMSYDLDQHALGIGMTGWDWKARRSFYVGFDFDALAGHADAHAKKLTDAELRDLQQAACAIPWITVRKSTGGNGIHLYVFLDRYPTETHHEHAAVARAILGKMAAITGYPFPLKVDGCGGNMWVYHRKMTAENQGLLLIKQGAVLEEVPSNWREHVPVVRGARRQTLPALIAQSPSTDAEALFDQLTSQRSHVALDGEHRRVIAALPAPTYWDQDRHMLVTHTHLLKRVHEELGLRGIFETASTGGSAINVYAFPMRHGAWALRRFTRGVAEHVSWTQDGQGWTCSPYNREPTLETASKSSGGIEHEKGGFVFAHASQAIEAAQAIGVNIELPPWALGRRSKLKPHKDGRLIVALDHDPQADGMAGGLQGWLTEGKSWTRVYHAHLSARDEKTEVDKCDGVVRHLTTDVGGDAGWVICADGTWVVEPLVHVKAALQGVLGFSAKEVTAIIGAGVYDHWRLVNRPFEPEYPGDRTWNRGAAQFRFAPTEIKDDGRDNLQYPHWLRILQHCGSGLDATIKSHEWCRSNGVLTGADYLKIWVASLFQCPLRPLPYLFFYSQEQNTGKSIFHEAIAELITNRGVERPDNALTNPAGFNGELANAVLCVVEEIDLSASKVAYNRIKDYVTSRTVAINPKGQTQYSVPNTLHFCQASNSHTACPVFTGDSRIVMVHVPQLSPEDLIPKEELLMRLRKEAPDFMAAVLGLDIPASGDRLNLPVITTGEKVAAERLNLTRLEEFLTDHCHRVTGLTIKYSEFVERFHEYLDAGELPDWSKKTVGKCLPPHFPKGRSLRDGQFHVGNISWDARPPLSPVLPPLVLNQKQMLVVSA